MGLTIQGTNTSADMSYMGFARLRQDIAYMVNFSFGHLYETYAKGDDHYDNELGEIAEFYIESHGKRSEKGINFLFMYDVAGQLAPSGCRALRKIIRDSGKETEFAKNMYGYAAWQHPATGQDFLDILDDCIKTKHRMEWR